MAVLRAFARGFVISVTLGLVATPAAATEWYRYQDDNGVMVLSHNVPPEFAHKGYSVLNDDGRVLRVVPRQLTPDEIVVRDAELVREAEQQARRDAAAERDRQLMQLYATPDEVEFAMNNKLDQIDDFIAKLKSQMQQKQQQLARYQTQAAEKERGQMPVSRDILSNIDAAEHEIQRISGEIDAKLDEKDAVRVKFKGDLDRIYYLYGLDRPIAAS
jgi:hypothetical protein